MRKKIDTQTKQEQITTLQGFIDTDCKYIFDYIDPDKILFIKPFLETALRSAYMMGHIESYIDTDIVRLFVDTVDNAAERSIIHRLKNSISDGVE